MTALPLLNRASQEDVAAGLAVLDEFNAAFNASDAARWSKTLHFPHIRFAGNKVQVWNTPEQYAADNSFQALAESGWHHSRWDFIHLVHADGEKLHFALQFTRYAQDERALGSFNALYVLTKKEGRWGVQSRSSYAGILSKNAAF